MFYVIGLGLCDEKDITVRGLEAVKSCSRVYLEAYTSILMVNKDRLVSPSSHTRPLSQLTCVQGSLLLQATHHCRSRHGRARERRDPARRSNGKRRVSRCWRSIWVSLFFFLLLLFDLNWLINFWAARRLTQICCSERAICRFLLK